MIAEGTRREPRRPAVFVQESVLIPDWIVDHETFRTWATSADCPEKSRVSFIGNMIWVDSSREYRFSHNQVKTEYTGVLGPLAKADQLGYFGSDANLWTNREAVCNRILARRWAWTPITVRDLATIRSRVYLHADCRWLAGIVGVPGVVSAATRERFARQAPVESDGSAVDRIIVYAHDKVRAGSVSDGFLQSVAYASGS